MGLERNPTQLGSAQKASSEVTFQPRPEGQEELRLLDTDKEGCPGRGTSMSEGPELAKSVVCGVTRRGGEWTGM